MSELPKASSSKKCAMPCVGQRIGVWWPLDETYYSGKVKYFDQSTGRHTVLYDDGEEEVLELTRETWRFENIEEKEKEEPGAPSTGNILSKKKIWNYDDSPHGWMLAARCMSKAVIRYVPSGYEGEGEEGKLVKDVRTFLSGLIGLVDDYDKAHGDEVDKNEYIVRARKCVEGLHDVFMRAPSRSEINKRRDMVLSSILQLMHAEAFRTPLGDENSEGGRMATVRKGAHSK